MSRNTLRLGLMAGAAAALSITGVAIAQTAPPAPQTKVERHVVVTNGGPGGEAMDMQGGGDVEQHVEIGPNGERRVIIIRHGGPGGEGPGMMDPGMMGPGMMGPHGDHKPMDPAVHAQHLRDILQLRADQEPALQAYITGTAPPEKPPEMGDPEAMAKMTTPERLDWMSARMAEHQAMFQKRANAIKAFYAALSPPQRKAFEAAHVDDMGMGGGMHMRMRMRHDGDGDMPMPPPPPPGK
jgi:hypothetical protein